MNNKLILVEGIPGSGKTTIANKIKEYFESQGKKVKLYNEGDGHPVDLAWIAYIPIDEYRELINKHPNYGDIIKKNTTFEEDYALVAYTKLGMHLNENTLMKFFENHEIYNARVSLDVFKKILFKRWSQFANNIDEDSITIFECAYLQNHINELLAYHNKDVNYIVDYMMELIDKVKNLNPKLIYLTQPSVSETINRVAKERVSSDKSKYDDWIDLVIEYIESCPYAKAQSLKGYEGVIKFFEVRKMIELDVIQNLSIDNAIISNETYNWDEVVKKVLAEIS